MTTEKSYYKNSTRNYNTEKTSSIPSKIYHFKRDYKYLENDFLCSTLTIKSIDKSEYSKSFSNYGKSIKVRTSKLQIESCIKETLIQNDTLKLYKKPENGILIYLSVLRYNGETIDICPLTRDYAGNWNFNDVRHRFQKSLITADQAFNLISNYGWSTKDGELEKSFTFQYNSSKEFPTFLTKTIEVMKLK